MGEARMTSDAPTLHYIDFEQFLADVEEVARQIETEEWRPDFLVGVGRGGLVPAAFLSHRLDIALLSVDHSSGEHGFAGELLDKLAAKICGGNSILIVDDINDSGATIAFLREAINAKSGEAARLRVAVLMNNIRSRAHAEYWGTELDREADKRWFVFPWEALGTRETLIGAAAEVPERLA
jgi:xanthine phosphoribosyltransferase